MAELSIFLGSVILGSSLMGNYNNSKNDIIKLKGNDNIEYNIKNDSNKNLKLNLLTELNKKVKKLLNYFKENNYFKNNRIKYLYEKYNPESLSENLDNEFTAYSVNKGDEIKLCLHNNSADGNEMIKDQNTAMFVLIHELAHIMTEEEGHPPQFWQNMSLLLEHAIKINIYKYVNYRKTPVDYCGVHVDDTPYIIEN